MPKYYKLLQRTKKQINFSARSKTHLTDFWLPRTYDKTSENCRRLGKLNIYCYKRKCPLKCSRKWVVIEQENPNLYKNNSHAREMPLASGRDIAKSLAIRN